MKNVKLISAILGSVIILLVPALFREWDLNIWKLIVRAASLTFLPLLPSHLYSRMRNWNKMPWWQVVAALFLFLLPSGVLTRFAFQNRSNAFVCELSLVAFILIWVGFIVVLHRSSKPKTELVHPFEL